MITDPHPNRKPFTGTLFFIGKVSHKSPAGARGRKVIVTRDAVERSLSTLVGMGVNTGADLECHNQRHKVGVITDARIVDNRVEIDGYLYALDFPEVVDRLCASAEDFGMSYEATDCLVKDITDKVWTIARLVFTGAAILKRDRAAYKGTEIKLIDVGKGEWL